MPRAVRVEYVDAVYHVICRGDRREAIFKDDRDRRTFLKTLAEVCERTGWRVRSYVLMDNHYHLLLHTPEPNLVRGMQWFQGTYTARSNARHCERGHLFQGRYKAIPIESEAGSYGRTVSDYIHLNPARARVVDFSVGRLADYQWSSFPRLIEGEDLPVWLDPGAAMASHGWSFLAAPDRAAYADYLESRSREVAENEGNDEQRTEVKRRWFLGSETFREKLTQLAAETVAAGKPDSFEPQSSQSHDEDAATRLLSEGMKRLDLSPEVLARLRPSDPLVQGLIWSIKTRTVMGDEWVADQIGCGHRSNIGRAVRRFRSSEEDLVRKIREKLNQ